MRVFLSAARWILSCVLAITFGLSSLAQSDDARFREAYARRYQALRNVMPDMVVMELRDRVEVIASRGSSVGVASTERRVRGFELTLLQGLQSALCAGSPDAARLAPIVVGQIDAAAKGQHLRTEASDMGELARSRRPCSTRSRAANGADCARWTTSGDAVPRLACSWRRAARLAGTRAAQHHDPRRSLRRDREKR